MMGWVRTGCSLLNLCNGLTLFSILRQAAVFDSSVWLLLLLLRQLQLMLLLLLLILLLLLDNLLATLRRCKTSDHAGWRGVRTC